MKKLCAMLCCAIILQMFCSCSPKKEEYKYPVQFYYLKNEISYNSSSGVLQSETREGFDFHNNLTAFLRAYLLGPNESELQNLIPPDVYLVSASVNNGVADIMLSSQFSKLSGIKLTSACSAILMSINTFTDAHTVHIRAKDAQLDDKGVFVLTMDDIVLLDTVTIQE